MSDADELRAWLSECISDAERMHFTLTAAAKVAEKYSGIVYHPSALLARVNAFIEEAQAGMRLLDSLAALCAPNVEVVAPYDLFNDITLRVEEDTSEDARS